MVGCHHQLNGHEFEQAPRAGDGQGSLACCSPWGQSKESETTDQLNCTDSENFICIFKLKSIKRIDISYQFSSRQKYIQASMSLSNTKK